MRVVNSKELEREYGIPSKQFGTWEEEVTNGIFHGEPHKLIVNADNFRGYAKGRHEEKRTS